jgi:hypothetical protein
MTSKTRNSEKELHIEDAKVEKNTVFALSPKRRKASTPSLITPSKAREEKHTSKSNASRRQLKVETDGAISDDSDSIVSHVVKSPTRRIFGRDTDIASVQSNTHQVYNLVKQLTGSIGGNGHGGAIYGELTIGSMQKMVDLMKIHTNLGPVSRFIDVGSGLGKPNLHVSQDPGVQFSYGIEMEHVRWMLGMSNLKVVLGEAYKQEMEGTVSGNDKIGHRCIFQHGDITEANYFDPFTHVYMFDIGFPPKLFKLLGEMFNRSQSEYLICYHGPKLMIDRYGFNVELITQASTSMHGSSECHMGYIYRRKGKNPKIAECLDLLDGVPCDKLFTKAWKSCKQDIGKHLESVTAQVSESLNSQRPSRKRKTVIKD